MLVVITPPEATPREIVRYNRLFQLGLHTLHLRIPSATREEYKACIQAIHPEFRHRVVLCDHFDLGEVTGTGGVHLRKDQISLWRQWQGINRGRVSVSAHSIEELQQLPFIPTYALLSPLFESISKLDYPGNLDRSECKKNLPLLPFPVVALGGITPERQSEALNYGFSGVAILGDLALAGEYLEEAFLHYSQPEVLTIAGHDPTSGAGLTADIRAIESNDAYPLSVCSSLTAQNEKDFKALFPVDVKEPLDILLKNHHPMVCKIGLISCLDQGIEIAKKLRDKKVRYIIWDPILKTSASEKSLHDSFPKERIKELLSLVTLITPNYPESMTLFGTTDPIELSLFASEYRVYILLKGGHNSSLQNVSTDLLFSPDGEMARYTVPRTPFDKHGTGCVLSAVIATLLSHGYDLPSACRGAQWKTDTYRRSSKALLGTHKRVESIEKQLRLHSCHLQYITDSLELPELLFKTQQVLEGGVRWIQLRMKGVSSQKRLEAAFALKELMQKYIGSTLIINDDLETALACDAHGVHLGLEDVSPATARKVLGLGKIIGGTCNTVADIAQRALEGVDYIGIGPYRSTTTKKVLSPVLGIEGIKALSAYNQQLPVPIPLFAIGGIETSDFIDLSSLDLQGIALSGAINRSGDITETAKSITQTIQQLFTQSKKRPI
ncbi:thiamine phosphate synthase [Porphyromonas circumdentaria]|uniref:Thiamine-phosphate synthase n=1 Tax=Porphyromonas circumdentaria TaxID=29524 RepID=A0A1T4LH29_9PORP|nr:thiamine phosphate synthase [Porphyromonas circumdentaria]MBB6275261.1 thiamine-phosphate pyrophosphorylase [Porphyromonas circumdentaria]SJZ53908.1 thiamine-phosphate pyrophosphorylase [Porphyromonas circumdentaria]